MRGGRAVRSIALSLILLLGFAAGAGAQNLAPRNLHFDIPAGKLVDAIDRFGEQSGLQIVYDQSLVAGHAAPSIRGVMDADDALHLLLAGSGLVGVYVNDRTVALHAAGWTQASAGGRYSGQVHPAATKASPPVTVLDNIVVTDDPLRVLPSEVSRSAFGFSKSLRETPRSVSFISQETIDLFNIGSIADLLRLVPGTYTPTRFGIQGGLDIRNVPADTYFRGMKRLNLQGSTPSILTAMDSIEIVRGPPSPIYGMGRIGGYTNMVPKSGRAADGRYLDHAEGFGQALTGSYNQHLVDLGIGGPLNLLGKHGGYYLYTLLEDSDSYARGVPLRAAVAQAAVTLDDFIGPFRLEAGGVVQMSRTAGALIGRFTQDVADSGRYIRGTPLVNLDSNGNGAIGYLEYERASPVQGQLSIDNQPLQQTFPWPMANGRPLTIDRFPKIGGIPQSMFDYLIAHPQADPTGLLRAQGVGGPRPISNYVPIGMVLDPRTVRYGTLDLRRQAAYERDLEAKLYTFYADLIYDSDSSFTVRNQLFFDGMDQFKLSEQPFGTKQNPRVFEDKLTLTRMVPGLPGWLRVSALASLDFRYTESPSEQCYGDFSNNRTDAMAPTWVDSRGGMTPNTTFVNCLENSNIDADGFPFTNHGRSTYDETGLGVLFDIDLSSGTDLLVGGRIDGSEARNIEYAGTLNATTGTAASPGRFVATSTGTSGWDDGVSWSVSLSQELPYGLRPYFTMARTSVILDNNINRLSNAVIDAGHIGQSQLIEAGAKAALFRNRLFATAAIYQQNRTDVNGSADPTVTADASSTLTRGWEAEIKWVPARRFFTSIYAIGQKTTYSPDFGGAILVDARTLGFKDVVDPATGRIVYPAEAFLYGGRALVALPAGMDRYREKQGSPNTQIGVSANYRMRNGIGFTFSGNYLSSVNAGRLQVVRLPEARVFNAAVFWKMHGWLVKGDVLNLTDERYFRARNGDALADEPVSAMPDRHWQFTVERRF